MRAEIPDDEPRSVVALIPAAGRAERLGELPCSKEILPVAPHLGDSNSPFASRPVCEFLLEALATAGIRRGYVILRPGKWDIPEHLERFELELDLAYLILDDSPSVPHTLDFAFRFVKEHRVALGFPDIVFHPQQAFAELLTRQESTKADIVLGLFPTDQGARSDMVELDAKGKIRRIVIKQPDSGLEYMWSIAVWTLRFTRFLHEYLRTVDATGKDRGASGRELFVGDVVQAALEDGLSSEAVLFPEGRLLDVGTPEGLRQAVEPGEPYS